MLRLLVLLLLLLNLSYLAWNEGWLLVYGWGPTPQREPQRLAQQIHPEAIVVLREKDSAATPVSTASSPALAVEPVRTPTSAPASTLAASAPAARVCLRSNPLDASQVQVLQAVLADNLEQGDWSIDEQVTPARWLIYMGRFANAAEQAAKREQLMALKIKFEPVDVPALAPGFMLGAFTTRSATDSALQALNKRGVRTAKITQVQAAQTSYRLRLPAIDPDRPALRQIKAAVPDMVLEPCTVAAAN